MSVDRNYTFQISTTADSSASRSEGSKLTGVASDKSLGEESGGVVNGSNNTTADAIPLSRVALIPEIKAPSSATEKPREITPQSTLSEPLEKPAEFFDEPTQFPSDAITSNQRSVVEPSKIPPAPDIPINVEFAEQIRRLESSFRVQATSRQDITETLSVIRQIREMLSEQQQQGVTRQELKRELQTLRLVMEGRK